MRRLTGVDGRNRGNAVNICDEYVDYPKALGERVGKAFQPGDSGRCGLEKCPELAAGCREVRGDYLSEGTESRLP